MNLSKDLYMEPKNASEYEKTIEAYNNSIFKG